MSGELVYTSDWEVEENDDQPCVLTASCKCPECGEEVFLDRDLDDEAPESGDSYDVECDCGCEFVVELT